MAEYIEREALMERLIKKKAGVADKRYTEGFNDALMRFRSMLHSAPTADVVEVVRCKECLHNHCMIGSSYRYCALHNMKVYADDFCSYGVAKMDGKEDNK